MITLGIECSSRQGSVALLQDGDLLAEKTWIADRVRHNTIFQTLETLIEETGISYNAISLFAVGRGPGSFSGMRMSFAIAQALALPGKKEVRAVSSGAALAFQVARASLPSQNKERQAEMPVQNKEGQAEMPAPRQIAVVGDARRGQVWLGLFKVGQASSLSSPASHRSSAERQDACPALIRDWELVPYGEVSVPEGTIVVSPEAERLQSIIPDILSRCSPLAKADANARFPHAKEVAELALAQTEPEPLDPLYMHPPVFIEPKYA